MNFKFISISSISFLLHGVHITYHISHITDDIFIGHGHYGIATGFTP